MSSSSCSSYSFNLGADKINGGSRLEEEKVRSWLYALAQSEKDLVFEYVRSTERGEFMILFVWIRRSMRWLYLNFCNVFDEMTVKQIICLFVLNLVMVTLFVLMNFD